MSRIAGRAAAVVRLLAEDEASGPCTRDEVVDRALPDSRSWEALIARLLAAVGDPAAFAGPDAP